MNFSVYPEEKERVQQIVIEEMERAYSMQVPLEADYGWGRNWFKSNIEKLKTLSQFLKNRPQNGKPPHRERKITCRRTENRSPPRLKNHSAEIEKSFGAERKKISHIADLFLFCT